MGGRGVPDEDQRLQRSTRDAGQMQVALTEWIDRQHPGADAAMELLGDVTANGMSSETLLADVTWTEDGRRRTGSFVVRMAPDPDDLPIFPTYQLDHQFELLKLVGELTDVPVPAPSWLGVAGGGLDAPFFFMSRESGRVPPDVLPYPFGDNWLFDATPEEQQRLQRSTIEVIAELHAIPNPTETFAFLPGDGTLAGHLAKTKTWYEWAVHDSGRSEMIDRAIFWLETNLPEETDPVLCWGDSRIGNVLYRDFVPEAVLDWEMADLGPRELDLAWLSFSHRVFQSIAELFDLPGMPDFLKAEDITATYTEITGEPVGDLTWFELYAATQWGCVFMRTGTRQARFGEIEQPDELEDLFHHRALFAAMLEGVGA